MSRGVSYGGGQSSLGYLFGNELEQPNRPQQLPLPTSRSMLIQPPPYGIETSLDENPSLPLPPPPPPPYDDDHNTTPNVSNNYYRSSGQNSGNFVTNRPSTKVKAVPGGDSSLGYLFGDK